MATIKGQNLRIFIGNRVLAMATSCTVQIQTVLREVSHKDIHGSFVRQKIVGMNWNITAEAVVCNDVDYGIATSDIQNMIGQQLQVKFASALGEHNATMGSVLLMGYAILNDVSITAQNRQRGTISIQMSSNGRIGKLQYLATNTHAIFKSSDGYLLTVH